MIKRVALELDFESSPDPYLALYWQFLNVEEAYFVDSMKGLGIASVANVDNCSISSKKPSPFRSYESENENLLETYRQRTSGYASLADFPNTILKGFAAVEFEEPAGML